MKAVIMAGGRATRYGKGIEKALISLGGNTLLEISLEKLKLSEISELFVAVSPNTPKTSDFCNRKNIPAIMTSGMGYHKDINALLEELGSFISLNVDCPFVGLDDINNLIRSARNTSISVVVPRNALTFPIDRQSTFTAENGKEYVWVGLNYVTSSDTTEILESSNWLGGLNINTPDDLKLAEHYLLRLSHQQSQNIE